jgi:biopolymer transport protein ExbB/TolQ
MKSLRNNEFLIEMFSLIIIVTLVQAVWVTVIRPHAAAIDASNLVAMAADKNFVPARDMYTILKDYEPETCVILSAWAFFIIGFKTLGILRSRRMLGTDLLSLPPGVRILPEDSREYARQIEALPTEVQGELLPRALLSGLYRFGATRNIQDVATAIRDTCNLETDRLDSELSMVRFVAWAIPAIGFVGTVRGIGNSLQQAHKAVEGDVSGVVAGLGTSFNATLVALSLSIVVMLCLHQMQLRQERTVLDTEYYLDSHLIRHLQMH